MNAITNAVTVTLVKTGESYHSLKDWGLIICNNDYLQEPEMESYYVQVPGRPGKLDYTDALTGRPVYSTRSIRIIFGGVRERREWDIVISEYRNLLHGNLVKLVFDNDPGYFWQGRATIEEFDRTQRMGTFALAIRDADPYKYSVLDAGSDWLWDTFSFLDGVIDDGENLSFAEQFSFTISEIGMPFVPVIEVKRISSAALSMTANGKTYTLRTGENRFPDLIVDKNDVVLQFKGNALLSVKYRRRML